MFFVMYRISQIAMPFFTAALLLGCSLEDSRIAKEHCNGPQDCLNGYSWSDRVINIGGHFANLLTQQTENGAALIIPARSSMVLQ
jgi:hypothetical protein